MDLNQSFEWAEIVNIVAWNIGPAEVFCVVLLAKGVLLFDGLLPYSPVPQIFALLQK